MITIIAGVAKNRVIGNRNELPWYLKEDLQRFKKLTTGHVVVMGRKTFESIIARLGKPLSDRENIVITSDINYNYTGVKVCHSINDAIETAKKSGKEIFIIGGQKIFEETFHIADRLEITYIDKDYEGDVYFPEIGNEWKIVNKESKVNSEGLKFSFLRYEKRGLFITFEGIDGCGKSTQMKKFAEYLFSKNKYNHVVLTREPYKNVNIRKLILADNNPLSNAEKFAELFISDRKNHLNEIIIPNIKNGVHVISDRYKLSTISYQTAQGMDMKDMIERHAGLSVPDMTIVVDLKPEVAMERMRKEDVKLRGKEHKFEANIDFSSKLRENYARAKELLTNEKIFIVDGNRTPDEIFADIKKIFEDNFSL